MDSTQKLLLPLLSTGLSPKPMSKEDDSSSASAPPPVTLPLPADGGRFVQLLGSAISSPAGSPRGGPVLAVSLPAEAVRVPLLAVPCFLAPASILEAPGFSGQFAMTHQAALAIVTAQAQMQYHAEYPSQSEALANSLPQPAPTIPVPWQQRPSPVLDSNVSTPMFTQPPSDQKSQSNQIAVKTSSDDGYSWRKYGQKQVKSSDRTRSYYRCTNANCMAKKKVERCPDGREIEIIFRGKHNHDPPQKSKYPKERGVCAPCNENETLDPPSGEVNESDLLASKTERISGNEASEQQLYCSSDCEGDAATKSGEGHYDGLDPKRRLVERHPPYSAPVLKMIKEPKIVVQSASDPACASDGYRWRKYGQKLVKGNPNPRSYYRCTHNGCPVRKHVEKSSDDSNSILITYEGKHNHDQPILKSGSDRHSHTPESSSHDRSTLADGELSRDKESMESAETLLSIGTNSSDGINRPRFSENCAAVPVHDS